MRRWGTIVSLAPEKSQMRCRARLAVASTAARAALRSVTAMSSLISVELGAKQPKKQRQLEKCELKPEQSERLQRVRRIG